MFNVEAADVLRQVKKGKVSTVSPFLKLSHRGKKTKSSKVSSGTHPVGLAEL